jgi:ADP-ribose pyrophosphatase YjhB (NUDIX family)
VPGGGIEEGESVEEAAVREAREETGIETQVVRVLGVEETDIPGNADPQRVNRSHFVQATPVERLPDEWEHEITTHGEGPAPVRCYWLPIRSDARVWGRRGHLLAALVRKRVVAYVTRGTELLVFEHAGTTQLPAGRIDAHESLEKGLVREIAEETGLTDVRVVTELADAEEFARLFGPGVHESHAFHAVTEAATPGAWKHTITGTGMDAGMVYPCRWVRLDECPPLWGEADPLVERLRGSITDK